MIYIVRMQSTIKCTHSSGLWIVEPSLHAEQRVDTCQPLAAALNATHGQQCVASWHRSVQPFIAPNN